MKSTTICAAVLALASTSYAATSTASGVEEPSAAPTLGTQVAQGCFSSSGTLVMNSTIQFNSKGSCATAICYDGKFLVAATSGGNICYCGEEYPPKSTLVDDSNCNTPCPGYGLEACGGIGFYTVYNTGIMLSVDSSEEESSSSASATATTTAAPSAQTTIVTGDQTSVVYVTASPTAAATAEPAAKQGSSNTVGIAVGVVVGAVVLLAVGGGIFFWMKRKRNHEIEEEHRRNAAINAFSSGKPPGSSSGYSIDTDARLDPVMAQRRMSSGSIADNQDYSRRILRVTNA